jgi:hAT family C-terminal dimerisation region
MLDPCNLGHSLPTLSCHNLENTLFETHEGKMTPSNASQHELLYMQYTMFFTVTSQPKNEKLFCYKVLLKGSKIPLEYWLVDGFEWPELQKIVTKLFSMVTSSATAEQNFSTMGFIHSKLCNSLNPMTVEKLVFIKSNLAAFYNLLQVVEYESSDSENENY